MAQLAFCKALWKGFLLPQGLKRKKKESHILDSLNDSEDGCILAHGLDCFFLSFLFFT